MPLSTTLKFAVQDHARKDDNSNHRKRCLSENNLSPPHKRVRETNELTMTDSQKRANFSALSAPSNGMSRHASPLANNKPGATKKLIIKNFKGEKLERKTFYD